MKEKNDTLPASYTICTYIRLSIEDDDISGFKVESGSITSQRKLIMDFIRKKPEFARCNVIERCDDGYSGTKFDTRPQFTDMISLAKQGKINCVIVKDCSRFGRDYVELGDYLEQLFPFLGVRFISINDGYDSDNGDAGLDIAFKNLVYDYYSRDLSKKARITRERLTKQGKYLGSQVLYGYRKCKGDKHKLEKDPEAAAVVREIFDKRLAGVGVTEIARSLNDRGILCPTSYLAEKGRSICHAGNTDMMNWTGAVVNGLLQNEIYTGTMVGLKQTTDLRTGKTRKKDKEEYIRVENTHEAIISREEYEAVMDLISDQAKHGKSKHRIHYVCGICGKHLLRINQKTIHCHREYAYSENSSCRGVRLNWKDADAEVLDMLKEKLRRILKEEELTLQKKKQQIPTEDQIRAAERAMEALNKDKKKLFEHLADRSISRDDFKKKKIELDGQIGEVERRISDLKSAGEFSDGSSRLEELKSFLDIQEMTEDIWKRFVDKVVVHPDKRLEIHWSFED